MQRRESLAATIVALRTMVVVELSIRRVPLPELCRRLDVQLGLHGAAGAPGPVTASPGAHRRARAAERVLRLWPGEVTCLRRSLVLAVVLRELEPVLRLGWRVQPSPAVAHAWLEVGGRSLDRDMTGVQALQGAPA